MPFREVNNIAEFENLAQEIRPVAEALENTRKLPPARFATPLIVYSGDIARCVSIFDDLDFGFRGSHGAL